MKRKDLIRILNENGCKKERVGKRHTIFYNPVINKCSPIPRHKEIKKNVVLNIFKTLKIEPDKS